MVFDKEGKVDRVDGFEEKIHRIQAHIMNNNKQLRDSMTKIAEHEGMLLDLIALTRGLGNKISEIPQYMTNQKEVSQRRLSDK